LLDVAKQEEIGWIKGMRGEDEVAQQDHLLDGLFRREKPLRRRKLSNHGPEVGERKADSGVFYEDFGPPVEEKEGA
jgi:hypothetical protein